MKTDHSMHVLTLILCAISFTLIRLTVGTSNASVLVGNGYFVDGFYRLFGNGLVIPYILTWIVLIRTVVEMFTAGKK